MILLFYFFFEKRRLFCIVNMTYLLAMQTHTEENRVFLPPRPRSVEREKMRSQRDTQRYRYNIRVWLAHFASVVGLSFLFHLVDDNKQSVFFYSLYKCHTDSYIDRSSIYFLGLKGRGGRRQQRRLYFELKYPSARSVCSDDDDDARADECIEHTSNSSDVFCPFDF